MLARQACTCRDKPMGSFDAQRIPATLRIHFTKSTLMRTSQFIPTALISHFSSAVAVRAIRTRNLSTQFQPSHLDDIEHIEGYRTGGFYPVHIGATFAKERYRVVHKLGCGGFSTVWLARDESLHRCVALEIITAEASDSCEELQILDCLRANLFDHPGQKHIASILDHFKVEGPNGTHTCLVSYIAGPTIAQLSYSLGHVAGSKRLRADIAQKAAWQATEALSCLHSRGVVHGGNFLPYSKLAQSSLTANHRFHFYEHPLPIVQSR